MASATAPVSSSRISSPPKSASETTPALRPSQNESPAEARALAVLPKAAARRRKLLVIAVAMLGSAVAATYAWLGRGIESTDDAQVDADIVAVAARTSGTVSRVLFVENQRVEKGILLAELDSAAPKARLKQAEATLAAARAAASGADAQLALSAGNAHGNLAMARAGLENTNAGALGTEESIREGTAALANARAKFAEAEQNLARARSLNESGAYSRAQFDQAQTARELAATELTQSEAKLASLQLSRKQAQSRVLEATAKLKQSDQVAATMSEARARADQAHAQVELALAARELSALELSYTKVYAPNSGMVSKKSINVGQSVSAGQPVVQLVPDQRWITANFKETQLGAMHKGQAVSVTIDAYPGVAFEGEVESLAAATGARFSLLPPDNATGNYTKVVQRIPVRVKVSATRATRQLVPGMSADVRVDTRSSAVHRDAHAAQAGARQNSGS